MEEYETVLLVKPEVFMFRIPPRPSNRGYRAADWKLDSPDWTGRMRVVSKGKKCFIKLEDKNTGELFAVSPVENYPGVAVEAVMDSSRYFVLRIEDDNGRAAFIGLGFADRGDSFDLNVSLQEHFKWLQKSEEIEKERDAPESKSNLDLSFKEGQTIKINMNIGKKSGNSKPRPKTSGGFSGTPGLLPPPPGGVKLPPPSKSSQQTVSQAPPKTSTNASVSPSTNDLLLDFASQSADSSASQTNSGASQVPPQESDFWGDFASASGETSAAPSKGSSSENWISF